MSAERAKPARPADLAFRRTDLDWVRIAAFGLLILFHIGMFYAPMDWVAKSPRAQMWLEIPLDWSSPWRLLVLFIVSGAATRFMGRKLSLSALLKSRSARLLPPLLFAIVTVIPLQAFFQAQDSADYRGSFVGFWGAYLGSDPALCRDGFCLAHHDLQHLWFVAYLWIYTVLAVWAFALWPNLLRRMQHIGVRWFAGWRLLALPVVALVAARLTLKHFFPETHNLVDDWYLHAVYLMCFAFGFLFATVDGIWEGLMRYRRTALAAGLAAYAAYAVYAWVYRGPAVAGMPLRVTMAAVYGIDQWAWVVAALGYARRYLSGRDGPVRRYLTEAIFPFYIVHQVAIVAAAHYLAPLDLPLGLEALMLVAITVASCVATYEIARRVNWLRPWLGLKRRPPTPVEASHRLDGVAQVG